MENLQFKRPKTLGFFILFALSAVSVLFAVFKISSKISNEKIYNSVVKNIETLEKDFKDRMREFSNRSDYLLAKFAAGELEHEEMLAKEALIIEEEDELLEYYGEIYHFDFVALKSGEWCLIGIGGDIYFLRKLDSDIFYVRFILKIDDNFLLANLKNKFSYAELKFKKEKVGNFAESYRYDEKEKIFLYNHLMNHSNDQIIVQLRFTGKDIEKYFKRKEKIFLYLTILVFLLLNSYYFYRKGVANPTGRETGGSKIGKTGEKLSFFCKLIQVINRRKQIAAFFWFAILIDLYFLSRLFHEDNLYMKLFNIEFDSTYQVLFILILLVSIFYFFRDKFIYKTINFLAFNLTLIIIILLSNRVLKAVSFVYSDFNLNFDYLSLVFLILLLHLLPLFFIRGIFYEKNITNITIFSLVQACVLILGYYIFKLTPVNILIFSIILFATVFVKKGFISRLIIVFLLALSIFALTANNTLNEKKEFIANNLKNIFLNQNNYARFIAREMVHEINSRSSNLFDFFQDCTTAKLVDIWRMSIARRENIASGIFLVSTEGEVKYQYSYQMPFLRLPTQKFFPFWAIEETTADLYGREISLAIASVSVKKRSEHLGYIIIQVLNSPRLILRHQDRINIFTINNKIKGKDLSYIKLSGENQILENPSNINLKDIAGILQKNNRWINFSHAGLFFNGYIFKHDQNSIIIFFPGNTFFKNFSEIIKIFIFLFLVFLLFYFKELRKVEWKAIYYSFSIRIFSILIVIFLLTMIVFSIFSLNFNLQSSQRKLRQVEYEKGRTAQNIGYNLLGESDEITPDHLFLISEILNSDVSVYENSFLLDSSNLRKIINAEIPIYLNSHILNLLNNKNQKFVLSNDGYNLFFKIDKYIFDVEFSYNWRKILSERSYHTDFILTLFFILAVIGFSSAFFFRNKILSPINELNRAMAEVEKGNLEKLRKIPLEKEIESLYLGFNSMVEGIRREKQNISEISRMKAIIKLGRRVAHEVKNPLTPIKLSAEQILKSLKDKNPGYEEIIKKSINFIMDETEHLKKVSYGFLDLSRLDEILAVEFDLSGLIKEEIFNFNQVYPNVEFLVKGVPGRCAVCLDKIKIKQVLINLLINGIEAIGDKKGKVVVNLKEEKNRVLIEVIDNGIGMDEENLDVIFNIDYSTKEIGTGIGLFIVKRIVDLHKGTIEVKSQKDRGTTVILDLPKNVKES